MKLLFRCGAFVFILALVVACGDNTHTGDEEPLARVFDKYLYPSDLQGIMQADMTKEDSVLMEAYIENWAKKNLMLKVAEKNIPKDVDIAQMLADYKASIIQHYYEENLVAQRLDSVVSQKEIQAFYEATKDDHILEETIARCYFIKLPTNSPNKEDLKKWWKMKESLDFAEMKGYAETYAQMYILEDSSWVAKEDLAAHLPDGTFNQGNFGSGQSFDFEKKGYWYLLNIKEIKSKGQLAPVAYVRDKAIRFILHKRKIALIENMATEMYVRELNKKNVTIYK